MMKSTFLRLVAASFLVLSVPASAQAGPSSQSIVVQGLRASAGAGGFTASAWLPDGSLVLLEDDGDGVRLTKTNASASAVLAQAHLGGAGDSGLAMAADAAGNLYVTGTSSGNGSLAGTSGTAFPTRADSSTNGFLAKFTSSLQTSFVTFLGAGRTAPTGVAATADAVFVTGSTYSTTFPVTASAIGQAPAAGSSGNGFVERFDATGGTLRYATLLTGYGGDTAPAAVAANSADAAYVVGLTSASGFPTVNALQPQILGTTSGVLLELTPAGDGYTFSTFVAGSGLTSIVLDTNGALILSGNISLGGFPVSTVNDPLAATSYQTLVRMPANGQTVTSSVLLVPGATSHVAPSSDGSVWVSGNGGALALYPSSSVPRLSEGDGFLLHVSTANVIDRSVRLGGAPVSNAAYATLSSAPSMPAVSPDGSVVAEASTLQATVAASLVATQHFDLPLVNAPNAALPGTAHDLLLSCSSGQCSGKGGLLTLVSTTAAASLALASDDAPNLRAYDLGSADAQGLSITASGFPQSNACGSVLVSGGTCAISLTGNGPGSVTLSAGNGNTMTASVAATTATANVVEINASELDFGVITAASPVSRSLTLTNFTSTTQTATIRSDGVASGAYAVSLSSADCAANGTASYLVAANSACHVSFTITASSNAANDSIVHAFWLVNSSDILLSASTQAASLSASGSELDFGVEFAGKTALNLPRNVYLSNNGPTPLAHATVVLPASSPFQAIDGCPESIPARSVCGIQFRYQSTVAPAKDTLTVALDDGLNVLLTGETLPQATATGSTANPNLSVTPSSVSFTTPVPVTGVASPLQSVTVRNTGVSPMPISVAASGDFTADNQCPATLNGGSSCVVLMGFTPSAPGVRQGVLSVIGGSGFAPTYVALSGTASAILPANNGVLELGQTYVGEPLFAWYKVQQAFPSLTAAASGTGFGVAIIEDTGAGHGTLPLSSFAASATSSCNNCWIGIAYTPTSTGSFTGVLSITSASAGKPYVLELDATALAVSGVLIDPISADFGTVMQNATSSEHTVTLTNLLPSAAPLNVISVQAGGDFHIVTNNTGGPSCAGTLLFTASCFESVVFTPTATGQRTGTLTFTTDQGTFVSMLTGFGTSDPGVAISPSSLVFANTNDPSATAQSFTITNTGSSTITVGTITSSNSAFTVTQSGTTLSPGDLLTVQVHFTPQQQFVSGTLTVPVSQLVNGQTVATNYSVNVASTYAANAAGLVILPSQANFGATTTGAVGYTRQFTLANFSGRTLNIALAMPRQFPLAAAPSACTTLASGASCVFSALFAPEVSGEATGTITVTGTATDGSTTLQAIGYLIGYGSGNGALSYTAPGIIPNAPLSFGLVNSGQTQSNTVTLKNSGTTALTIRRLGVNPPFFATTTCGATMAPGATCTAAITYAPIDETSIATAVPRADLATLTVESDATSSPTLIALSGSVQPVAAAATNNGATLNSYALSTSALSFSNEAIGSQSSPQAVTLLNTGNTTLHVTGVLGTPDFAASTDCGTVAPGSSCNVTVVFAPSIASTAALRDGSIEIQSDASNALDFISVLGPSSPSPLQLSATSLDFGSVALGSRSQLGLTLTNTTLAPITFLNVAASGDYAVANGTCQPPGSTLPAGSSCVLYVTFAPTVTGTRSGTLSITTDATQLPLTVALTGIGAAGRLTASPSALAFGPIATGATSNLVLTLTNAGTANVSGIQASVTGANAASFAVTVPCAVAQLVPGASCSMTVQFAPTATGSDAATLTITSSDPASPLLVPLTGSGAQNGGITLTVDGGAVSSRTVTRASPASYALIVTPTGGFTGTVALTCTPVQAAPYGTCSLLPSMLTFTAGSPQSATATINTVTSMAVKSGLMAATLLLLPFGRRKRGRLGTALLVVFSLLLCGMIVACGGGGGSSPGNLLYTPPGTYQYTVTASSTTGPATSASVTLNLTVQ